MKPIRNVIFDMGNVLMYFAPDVYIDRVHAVPEDHALLFREIFRSVEWVQMDRGTLSDEDAVKKICSRLPERLHEAVGEIIHHWWKGPLMPVPGMSDLIRELKEAGYGIYMLSNANVSLHKYFPRIPGSEYFDGAIVSADWHELKPQKEIFERLHQIYGLDLEECVFIDDTFINVEGAVYAGLQGIIFFDDMAELRKKLHELGVQVSVE